MKKDKAIAPVGSPPIKIPEPRLSPEDKWEELKRHLLESLDWYRAQQENPKADTFYFFLKSGTTADIVGYIMRLDGIRDKDNALLWSLYGDPVTGFRKEKEVRDNGKER